MKKSTFYFYEDDGLNFSEDMGYGMGSTNITKSKFATIGEARNYMKYCPYPIDYCIFYDVETERYRIKFETGVARHLPVMKQQIEQLRKQLKVLQSDKLKDYQKLLHPVIIILENQLSSAIDEMVKGGWESNY